MNTLIKILIAVAIITFFVMIAKVGIAKQEKVECYKLQKQAQEYKDFYLTKDESDMCSSRGVIINARVQ